MKILVCLNIKEEDTNTLALMLVQAFAGHPNVSMVLHGAHVWRYRPFALDILHIHQPEALFSYQEPTDNDLAFLERKLSEWKRTSKLVVTVHNTYPHFKNTANFRALYNIVYHHADGFIHRGVCSRQSVVSEYPFTAHTPHAIIPAGINTFLNNTISAQDARNALHVDADESVFLAFGNIRHVDEVAPIRKAFDRLPAEHKRLVISAMSSNGLTGFRGRLERYRLSMNPRIMTNFAPVPADQVQNYMNAADVLLIPRIASLNSANVQLGFAFSKVTVGPDYGVVGEILKQTGNPVFKPGNIDTLLDAMKTALELSGTGLGNRNHQYAMENWDWKRLTNQHVEFFRSLLNM